MRKSVTPPGLVVGISWLSTSPFWDTPRRGYQHVSTQSLDFTVLHHYDTLLLAKIQDVCSLRPSQPRDIQYKYGTNAVPGRLKVGRRYDNRFAPWDAHLQFVGPLPVLPPLTADEATVSTRCMILAIRQLEQN